MGTTEEKKSGSDNGVDDPDLGCRPVHAGLLALADKMDADRDRVAKERVADLEKATRAIKGGRHQEAAECYDLVANAFRAVGLPGDADYWERRARDCREVVRRREKSRGRKR